MKYKGKVNGIEKELTIYHWEKLRYFSTEINSVWAYCYLKSSSDTAIKCLQLYLETDFVSGGRKVNLIVSSDSWSVESKKLEHLHRQWNHF